MRGKRAREERRTTRARRAMLERGAVEPTREERVAELRRARAAALAEAAAIYHRELAELQAAYAQARESIEQDFHRQLSGADGDTTGDLERLGIVVAPAHTDLTRLASEVERATGRKLAGR